MEYSKTYDWHAYAIFSSRSIWISYSKAALTFIASDEIWVHLFYKTVDSIYCVYLKAVRHTT